MTHRCAMALVGAILLTGAAFAESRSAARASIDTSYIAPDSAVVVFVNVRQLLGHPVRDLAARKLVVADLFDDSGFDFSNVTHVLVQFGAAADSECSFDELYAVTFRFDRPFEKDALVTAMLDRAEPAEFQGSPYYRSAFEGRGCAFFPDEQTVIFAHQSRLHAIIESPYTMSTLVSQLRAADDEADFVAAIDMTQAPDLVPALARGALGLELPANAQRILRQITSATATVRLAADDPLQVQILGKNAESARQIVDALQALRQFCQDKYVPLRKDILSSNMTDARVSKLTVELLDKLLSGTLAEQRDDQVVVRLQSTGGVVSALDLFFEAHAAEMRYDDGSAPAVEIDAGFDEAIEIREPALPR